ncbi:MAG: SDR family oxidoreductase, partial [Sphingomonadaceae bacterium]|nr:SDR family oxidoreductase [Sphingomonadaceae bacterium]
GATLLQEGEADIFVHIAPATSHVPAHEQSHEDWRRTLDAGLDQRFLQASEFAKQCQARGQGGAILFVGAPEQSAGVDQAAAAGGLGNLTKTLGVEWARDGIRVNSILTHRNDDTVGNLAAYLVSDYAAYVTGAVMGVDEHD